MPSRQNSPLGIKVNHKRPSECLDFFAGFLRRDASPKPTEPLGGKSLKTPSLRYESSAQSGRYVSFADDPCQSSDSRRSSGNTDIGMFAKLIKFVGNNPGTERLWELKRFLRSDVLLVQDSHEARTLKH